MSALGRGQTYSQVLVVLDTSASVSGSLVRGGRVSEHLGPDGVVLDGQLMGEFEGVGGCSGGGLGRLGLGRRDGEGAGVWARWLGAASMRRMSA